MHYIDLDSLMQKCLDVGYDHSFSQSFFMQDLMIVFSQNLYLYQNYINLNATKRPFRHLDVRVGKRENHVICIFKIYCKHWIIK